MSFTATMTNRQLLLMLIQETESGAARMRELARQCKAEAQALEERAVRYRSSLPPEKAPDEETAKK